MIPTQVISDLLKKERDGSLSLAEKAMLQQWIEADPKHEKIYTDITAQENLEADLALWLSLQLTDDKAWLESFKAKTIAQLHAPIAKPKNRIHFTRKVWLSAAALAAALALFFIFYKPQPAIEKTASTSLEIAPGTNKASLTLSNGQQIELREDKEGIVMDKNLIYSDGTRVLNLSAQQQESVTATIVVPKGGKYQIRLSDGSKVWLNAQSTLSYPLTFNPEKRELSLEGEAYFEVATLKKNAHKIPFYVISKGQRIEVTGTQFNVSAYPENKHTLTTLVEGAVTVHAGQKKLMLQPNQQAQSGSQELTKKQVDIQSYVAWRHNKFVFNETELQEVIQQLTRWYNIDAHYASSPPEIYFYGEIDRDKPLSEVLKLLRKSGVKFSLKQGAGAAKTLVIL